PAEVYAVVAQPNGKALVLTVDARDVDVREGTMPINVLQIRAGLVAAELPPERPRRRMVWLSQAMVLDCPAEGTPPSPVALVEAEGDRGGTAPGDPSPSESVEEIRERGEAEADARSKARTGTGLPSATTDDDEPEEERTHVYTRRPGKPRRQTDQGEPGA